MVTDELIHLGDGLYDLSMVCRSFADNEKCRRDHSAVKELGEFKGSRTCTSLLGLTRPIIERQAYRSIRQIVPTYSVASEHRQLPFGLLAIASGLAAQLTYRSRE